MTTAASAPARATTSHRSGAALPNSANGMVKIIGSGFHEVPPLVMVRWPWMIWRLHTSQDHGS